jgi:hypothetical protein
MTTQYFGSVAASGTEIIANAKGSKFNIAGGDNIAVSANTSTATVTVSVNGVMGDELPVTQDDSTNATNYVLFNSATSGFLAPKVDSGLYYNPFTGVLAVSAIRFGDNTQQSSSAFNTQTFNLKIAGDDSTQRTFDLNETIQFVGAGGITVTTDAEAKVTITATSTPTITGGSITGTRINPRAVAAGVTSGTLTPNGDTTDVFNAFGLTGTITVDTPSGTPVDGQRLILRFEDNGSGRNITWTTSSGAYRAVGTTLPTTTVASKITYVGCVYNSTDIFWDAIAVATQA